MAKRSSRSSRNRYRHMEVMMTRVILGVLAAFILFLIFAWQGIIVWKLIFGILAMAVSALSLGWLYITGEFSHRRSLWMITTFMAIIVCTIVSLVFNYPCPPITL